MSSENKKNAHLQRHLGAFFIRLNELGLTRLMSIFTHLKKSLEIFDENSADKNLNQKGQGVESALPHAN